MATKIFMHIIHKNFRLFLRNAMAVNSMVLFAELTHRLVSSYSQWIMTGATCVAGNAHSFRNIWFHSLWAVHDFTCSLYIFIFSDSEQCSNRVKLALISILVQLSCELGQIKTRYDFILAERVILSNLRTDSNFGELGPVMTRLWQIITT